MTEAALYLWRKARNAPKRWRKTRREKCGVNRKMTFLSHGKPENFKISAENGKQILKTAETGKLF